ncbi:hypothetical protein GX586_08965 [bacterium]|nr:hypothetical protein [bacterium]
MFSKSRQFRKPSKQIEKRIDGIISAMTLEEKVTLLGGTGGGTKPCDRVGIPAFKMSDGPVGVHWFTDCSTTYPASILLAASWDREMSYKVGAAIGRDARARGIHILLAPGVNIYRSPLCGRNFEYLGEDPYLAAQMVAPYIRGCQDQAVAATVKHYACNFQEYDRHHVSTDVDERTLREVYLPAFEAAVKDGGTGALMTSYNLVNGQHASEHTHLIREILKGEWGFDGLVMSDWASTYDGVSAANNGLDLEMPNANFMTIGTLIPAVKDGRVCEEVIDDKIRRLLRLAYCFGWMDHEQKDEKIPLKDEATAKVALEAARGGIVLLKNENKTLPLDAKKVKKIAVIGPTAHPAVIGGGGSAYNTPWRTVSILEGIKAQAKGVEVAYAIGVDPWRDEAVCAASEFFTPDGAPGIRAEYFNNLDLSGEAALTRVEERMVQRWFGGPIAEGIQKHAFSARWNGIIRPAKSGPHVFYQLVGGGKYRMTLGDRTLFDADITDWSGIRRTTVELEAGREYPVYIEYRRTGGWNFIAFAYEHEENIYTEWQKALELAREADAVIFCGGHNQRSESEGSDRTFGMAPELEQLLVEVAAVNHNTTVVLTAGGNIDAQRWIDSVRALVMAWYPGQEGGTAVGEVLFGAVNPSGKLPATFEKRLEDRSSFASYHDADNDKRVALADGIFTGYRHNDLYHIEPRFPFGFGMSYTTFAYEKLRMSSKTVPRGGRVTVSFDVVNTGTRAGAEVAQVYVTDCASLLPRPVKELKGFAKVVLKAGERATVKIVLDEKALQFYHPERKKWIAEPGTFSVLVGASSADIRLRGSFEYGGARAKRAAARPARRRKSRA